MNLDTLLTGAVLLAGFFAIFYIGKKVNDLLHKEYDLNKELVHADNPALALALVGYYAGLVLTIGGALVGPTGGIVADLQDLFIYGLSGVVLLNISWYLCDKVILRKFKVSDELVRDHNQGTGAVVAGACIASGFILFGSIQGEGDYLSMLVFWASGQVLLILAAKLYNLITPYDIHDEIEKDNVPAGVSAAGALIGMGTLIGLAAENDFVSWAESYPSYLAYAAIGLAVIPTVRLLTDKLLLPGVNLTDEIVNQEKPNLGAAYIEAFSYIAAAFAIYWCV
ncbi:MAG: DUF350 domain-containing protein [Pseudodesulfovibrio sp.]